MRWRWLVGVFAVTFVVYALSPVRQNYDSYLAFPTAQSIVHERNLTLGEFDSPKLEAGGVLDRTADGAPINYFPWMPSLVLVPSVVALDVLHAVGIGPGSFDVANGGHMDLVQQLTASFVMAIVVAAVYAIAFGRLRSDTSLRRRRITALVVAFGFAFGTAAWSSASRAVWQHGPALLCLAAAVLCVQRLLDGGGAARRRMWLSVGLGAAVVASYTCRPTNAIAVVGFTIFVAARLRPLLWGYLAGAAGVSAVFAAVNLATFGTLSAPYFSTGRVGLHDEYGEALAMNLVSPARGLLLFSPIVLLAGLGLMRRFRGGVMPGLLGLDRTMMAMSVLYVLATSGLMSNWWAGHSFGPRYLADTLVFYAAVATPAVAALLAPGDAVHRATRWAAVLLLGWSVLVNFQGGVMRSTLCWNGDPDIDAHPSRVWDFSSPQMLSGVAAVRDSGVVDAVFTRCV